ncbi:Protein arginine N-methyltransferase 1 [Diplonema papillatum]|nr:Protein arginine N-methyltransferase 1 [Diplonema papillatum]
MTNEDEKTATSADFYFDPRARFTTHEQSIKDGALQGTLAGCILENASRMQGKTILIIESGLGLLSMQCARDGGAAKVIGIEPSSIVTKATGIAADNGLADKCVFYRGVVGKHEFPIEPHSVDIIFCEWVGHLLSNHPITKQLIKARELYLKEDGAIIPDTASLHLTACWDRAYKSSAIGFWDNVYGFKMSAMKPLVYTSPVVSPIPREQCVTAPVVLHTLNAYTMTEKDCDIESSFELLSRVEGKFMNYLIAYVSFGLRKHGWKGFNFFASPEYPVTHWQQTCFTLEEDLPINKHDVIEGKFVMKAEDAACKICIDVDLDTPVHKTKFSQDFLFHNG